MKTPPPCGSATFDYRSGFRFSWTALPPLTPILALFFHVAVMQVGSSMQKPLEVALL